MGAGKVYNDYNEVEQIINICRTYAQRRHGMMITSPANKRIANLIMNAE